MEKLKKFLKSIGIEADLADKMVDEAQDFDPAKAAKAVKGVIRTSLENDEDFISEMDNNVRGRVLSSKENKILKLTGITREELEALPKEKRFDALLELMWERGGKGEAGAGGDEALKKEVNDLRTKLQKAIADVDTEKENTRKATQASADERERMEIESDVRSNMGKRKLILEADEATELTLNRIYREFTPKRVNGKTVLFKKGTELKATDPETEREVTLEGLLDKHVEDRRWKQVSNGPAGGGNRGDKERLTTNDDKNKRQEATGPGAPKRTLAGAEAAQAASDARAARVAKRAEQRTA
jgi:hypothetical protein